MPRFKSFALAACLAASCAPPPPVEDKPPPQAPAQLPALPATYENTPGCAGCLAVTITLRPDGSYLVRERIGDAEFYDFGRWRRAEEALELTGGRDAPRRYALRGEALDSLPGTQGGDLKRVPKVETLRGPFRMVGLYDGSAFRECRTGLAWRFSDTRAAQALKDDFAQMGTNRALVSLDAQFEGRPETLRVLRPAALLNARACP